MNDLDLISRQRVIRALLLVAATTGWIANALIREETRRLKVLGGRRYYG